MTTQETLGEIAISNKYVSSFFKKWLLFQINL